MFVAFVFRLILLVIQSNGIDLPQAGADSVRFERIAYYYSIGTIKVSIFDVLSNGAHLHSYIGSLIYSIVGREPIIWSFLFILLGLGTVYNIYRSVLLVSNKKFANRAAWIACFYPNIAIFSVILLREIYMHFFISLAAYYFIKYLNNKSQASMICTVVFGVLAALFHSAMLAFIVGVVLYIILFNKNVSVFSKVMIMIVSFIGLYYINSTGAGLDKVGGSFETALDAAVSGGGAINESAGSNYASWLMLGGGITDLLLVPLRLVAFLFAPFIPFFVRSASHLIGVVDGFFYFIIFYNIYKNWSFHKTRIYSKGLLVVILTVVFAFSFGASNFGTNIRHRAKILPVILMIPLFTRSESKYIKKIISK